MHSLELELFNKYKDRADKVITDLPEKIDPRILGLVAAINTNPHVAPTWSCSGHTFDENNKNQFRERIVMGDERARMKPASNRWYMTFVISPDGVGFIEQLNKAVFDINCDLHKLIRPKLIMTTLGDLFSDGDDHYNSWCLEGMFRETEEGMVNLSAYWDRISAAIHA